MLSWRREVIVFFGAPLVVAPLILGCGKKETAAAGPPPASGTPAAASAAPALAVQPAVAAAAAPAGSAEPAAAPPAGESVLATQDYSQDPNLKCDVLQVKRVSGGALLIKWRMTHRGPQGSKEVYHAFSWSNVYFTDPAENKKYLGLKDSTDNWIAQGDNKTYHPGEQQGAWMKFPAPPAGSSKITFIFQGFPPFEDLPVSP